MAFIRLRLWEMSKRNQTYHHGTPQ